jgi:hypothetical protein
LRWWTSPKDNKPKHFLRCECGWVDLPHYAQREHAKSFKCETFKPRNDRAFGAGGVRFVQADGD